MTIKEQIEFVKLGANKQEYFDNWYKGYLYDCMDNMNEKEYNYQLAQYGAKNGHEYVETVVAWGSGADSIIEFVEVMGIEAFNQIIGRE